MAKRLVPASSRPLAALALLGALCACASTSAERPTAQPAGWRIVERTGEARHLPPAAGAWLSATIGEALADGSEVSTGRGARLIVDAPGRNISVGPNSRFVLPGSDGDDLLDQRAGSLRYRVAEAAEPLHIHTRSLELELVAGVVDVHVNDLATEVSVKEGQVRVATPDGLRQTQIIAGQSAHAGTSDEVQLAVRSAPGGPFQPVEQVIVPAIQPKAAPAEMPRSAGAARSVAAPSADRAVDDAPTLMRQAAPGGRAQLAADVVETTPGGRPAAESVRAADDVASPAVVFQGDAEGLRALDPQRQLATPRATESPAAALRRAKSTGSPPACSTRSRQHRPAPIKPQARPGERRPAFCLQLR